MAKTRLNKGDRDNIAAAIIEYKYKPDIAANRAQEYALAKAVYERVYTADVRKKMAALPDGAFPKEDDLTAAVNGQKFELHFSARRHDELGSNAAVAFGDKSKYLPVLYKHHSGYSTPPMLSIMDDDPLGASIVEWRRERDRLKEEPGRMRQKLDATLSQFLYFDDLVSQFPEAEKFILKRWRERPEGGSPGVPAVVIKDLARELDLPPDVEDEAEAA